MALLTAAVKAGVSCTATATTATATTAVAAALIWRLILVVSLWHPLQTQHTTSSGQDITSRHWRRNKIKSGFWSHKIIKILLMDFISWYDEDGWSVGVLLSYNNAIRTHRSPTGCGSHTCAGWKVPSGLQGSDSAQSPKRTLSGSSCRSAWTELLQHPVEKHQLHCHHCHDNMRRALLLLVPTYCIPGTANHVPQRVNSVPVLILTKTQHTRVEELISLCVYMDTKIRLWREIRLWRKLHLYATVVTWLQQHPCETSWDENLRTVGVATPAVYFKCS